jgi:hypothetical protein
MRSHYPEDESEEAREGTAAHFAAAEAVRGRPVAVGAVDPVTSLPMTAEMVECGGEFARDVLDTLKAASHGSVVQVEQRQPAGFNPQNWGTPDAYIVDRPKLVLHLWDYKFGHRYVDAYMNWQLLNYAILILLANGVPPEQWRHWTITMTVYQPRNYHPAGPLREWHLAGDKLLPLYDRLKEAAAAALLPGAPLKTGAHCRDCRARTGCPALQRVAMSAVDLSFEQQRVDMPPEAVGLELAILKAAADRIKARVTGLEEQALATIRSGVDVPHWTTDYSYGRTRWKVPVAEVLILGQMYGVDLGKPPEAITPTQAKKAGVDPAVIAAYSETPRGVMALIHVYQSLMNKRFGLGRI